MGTEEELRMHNHLKKELKKFMLNHGARTRAL